MTTNQGGLLIVDDDAAIRTILRHFLESKGYEVSDAADTVRRWTRLPDSPLT